MNNQNSSPTFLRKPFLGFLSSLIALVLIGFPPVYAQEGGIEEVFVTATKRAESVQDIGSSVSAISGDELEARGAVEFFDYAITVPNLSFGSTDDGILSGRTISLRGVQGEETTGFYIDDTPISETIDPRVLDLERIEVLRGPQGTLYGARSFGGTIRQITRKPQFGVLSGKIRAGFSLTDESDDFNSLTSFSINAPIGDKTAVTFSGLWEEKAGVYDRNYGTVADFVGAPTAISGPIRTVEDVDNASTVSTQIAFRIQATDSLVIEPRIMYQKIDLDGFPLSDNELDNFDQNRATVANAAEGGEDEWSLMTLNFNKTTADGLFTAAFSYLDRETFEFEESGAFINQLLVNQLGVPAGQLTQVSSPIYQRLESEYTTAEFRFASDVDGPVNYVVGLFYQQIEFLQTYDPRNIAVGLDDNLLSSTTTPLRTLGYDDLIFASYNTRDVEDLGLFTEVTWNASQDVSLIFGGRYYDTSVDFLDYRAGLAASSPPLAAGVDVRTTTPFTDEVQSEDGFNLKFGVEWAATEDILLYGLIAEGFRIGGINEFVPATSTADDLGCLAEAETLGLTEFNKTTYDSDSLISYELGIKTEVNNNTRVNVSVFQIDIEDIQQRFPFSCGFPLTANFGDATSRGIELEVYTEPADGLTITFNVGFTDAEFTEDIGTNFIRKGDPLQQVPEFTAAFSIDYWTPRPSGGDFFIRLDANFVDESITRTNTGVTGTTRARDAYEQVNLRMGYRKDAFTFTAFTKNLTNDIANLGDNRSLAAETPGRIRYVASRPLTIGMEVQYEF